VYLRKARDPKDHLIVAANFTPVPRRYRIGVPEVVWYEEIFNSDAPIYGGTGVGNAPGLQADSQGSHFRPAALDVTMPPLGMTILKPRYGA
jgi:1,4-alpha-glucan branching enzyme